MKKLKELINEVDLDIDILGITDDSRKVEKGFLFVATKGFNEDHYLYVDDAIKKEAAFVVTDREIDKDFPIYSIYSLGTENNEDFVRNLSEMGIECTDRMQIGPTIGTHIGAGAYGIIFVQK